MRKLSLFSGIGGIDLAAHWAGMKTVAFCEREPFPQKVLRKHWPDVPIYDDVCELTAEKLKEDGIIGAGRTIDIISAGYPCQPFSVAGNRAGKEDDRHLWPEVARLLREIRPRWFVGENVAGHISLGLDDVLAELESIGYTAQAFVIPSSAVGAPHRRDRVFVLGYTEHVGSYGAEVGRGSCETSYNVQKGQSQASESKGASGSTCHEDVGNASNSGLQERRRSEWETSGAQARTGVEPELERSGENVANSESDIEGRLPIRTGTPDAGLTCGCEDVANTEGKRCGKAWEYQPRKSEERVAGSNSVMADSNSSRQQKCYSSSFSDGSELDSRGTDERGSQGAVEPGLGGVLDGISSFVDGYKWPAGLGAEQYDWEPPRVATGVKDRVGRLKALGNAVNPVQIYPIMAAIKAIDDHFRGER